jgi:hypothetical protein
VANLCRGPGFLDHAGAQLVGGHPRLEQLDGDVDAELLVGGPEHVGHATAADVGAHGVAPGDHAADEVVLDRLVRLRVEVADGEELEVGTFAGAGHRGALPGRRVRRRARTLKGLARAVQPTFSAPGGGPGTPAAQ